GVALLPLLGDEAVGLVGVVEETLEGGLRAGGVCRPERVRIGRRRLGVRQDRSPRERKDEQVPERSAKPWTIRQRLLAHAAFPSLSQSQGRSPARVRAGKYVSGLFTDRQRKWGGCRRPFWSAVLSHRTPKRPPG